MERSLGVSALPGQLGRWGRRWRIVKIPQRRAIAKGDTAPGYAEQAALLEAEGVPFLSDGRGDLKNGQKGGKRHE